MNPLSTDLDRDFNALPDDPQATKERIILLVSSFLIGILFGIAVTMAYFSLTGKTCSADGYCSVHKVK